MHLTSLDPAAGVVGTFTDLVDHPCFDRVMAEILGGAGSSHQLKTEHGEGLSYREARRFVPISE
jgi:hypothetical protein